MELVYLWVEEYKNIKNQGFNFSPRFECSYDGKNLNINEKEDYVDIFPNNINITAIVGENGSGKSNILNLMFNEHIMTNVFFILKIRDDLKIYGITLDSMYPNNTIKKTQLQNKIFKCSNLISGKLANNKLAFYTPLLQDSFTDNKHNYSNQKFNLSPASLLEDYKENQQIYKDVSFQNLYNIYESNFIQNSIDMIKNCQNLKLPFDIPTKLTISVNIITEYEEYLTQYNFLKEKTKSENSFYGYMEQRIIKNWFSNLFQGFYQSDTKLTKPILEQLKQNFGDSYSIDKLIKICSKEIEVESESEPLTIGFLTDELKNIKIFLETIKQLSAGVTGNHLKLEIGNIPNDFISQYNKVIASCSNFLDFSWTPKLSSGQQTFLSQFSLFYKYLNKNDKTFLLIDEGESTLHPNWQKMYIKYIVDFFTKNLKNKKIHIIFSSHSPFILSDLAKENVIFLKDGKQVDVDMNPFGANIHTLLSHGFFMKGGLMGKFAKSKINKAIGYLNKKELSKDDIDYCEDIISIIGEPLIKNQLQKMLDSKRLSKIDKIDLIEKQIKELQKELRKEKK